MQIYQIVYGGILRLMISSKIVMNQKMIVKRAINVLVKNRCYIITATFYFTINDSKRESIVLNMPNTSSEYLTSLS